MEKNKKVSVILLGAGSRSRAYTAQIPEREDIELIGVVEPDAGRRKVVADRFSIPEEMQFTDEDAFFARGKIADGVIIATMDQIHCRQAKKAIDCGYGILLEKPIGVEPEVILDLLHYAEEHNGRIMVCHVLRYAPFFHEVKRLLDAKVLGNIMSIEHCENVCIFHFSHSFVRGSWRRQEEAAPIILAKSCHDMDILTWLAGSRCESISSYGDLSYFNEQHAPEGAAMRCYDCKLRDTCIFDGERIYLGGYWWNKGAVNMVDQSDAGVIAGLKSGPYGRCVFHSDNDVCDHQVCAMKFENGIMATFQLNAFTNECNRNLRVMCEQGEITGDVHTIRIRPFGKPEQVIDLEKLDAGHEGHGGGDTILLEDYIDMLNDRPGDSRTTIAQSMESHFMAFAAEKSRLEHRMVDLSELR